MALRKQVAPPSERRERAQAYANRAVATSWRAMQNGYKDVAHMKEDPDLIPLRSHSDFQKLLKELQTKASAEGK